MRLLRDAQLVEEFIDEVTFPNGSPYKWKTCSELFWSISKADPHASVEKILSATPYTQANPSLAPMIACRLLMVYEAVSKAKEDAAEARPDAADDVEKPLPPKLVEQQDRAYKQAYDFNPNLWLKPGEKTRARVWRWLQPGGHKEVFPVEVMKSLERPVKPDTKTKASLGNGFSVTQDHAEERADKVTSAFEYRNRLMIWAYAMAWSGTEKVQTTTGAQRQCPLDTFVNYAEDAHRKAIRTQNPLAWIRERDEKTRAKMIEYMRNPEQKLPAGKALEAAKNELHSLWDIEKETANVATSQPAEVPALSHAELQALAGVVPGRGKRQQRRIQNMVKKFQAKKFNASPKAAPKPRGKSKGKGKGRGKAWSPVSIPGGKTMCPAFQLGQCPNPAGSCSSGLHACNRVTRAGKTCGCKKGFKYCASRS